MKIKVQLAQQARRKAARENRDINISVIALETGLVRNTVSDMWHNRRLKRLDLRTVETLCDYLDCRFDELVVQVDEADEESGIEMRVPYPTEFAVLG